MGSEIHEEKMKIEDYAESKANVKSLKQLNLKIIKGRVHCRWPVQKVD